MENYNYLSTEANFMPGLIQTITLDGEPYQDHVFNFCLN